MKIYQTNDGLGYNQLAYLLKIEETVNGHTYLIIGGKNLPTDCDYKIGELVEDSEDLNVETSKINQSTKGCDKSEK